MSRIQHTLDKMKRRKFRVRATVSGTTERPRLSIFISNRNITAQIIDDTKHKTLAYCSSVGSKLTGSMTEKAVQIGQEIAQKAKTAKVKQVVFDRNGKLYHGRVKALADAAREAGLEF